MRRRMASAMILMLLLTSMLMLAFQVQPVRASGTVYIRADGSIDPPTAPISSADNVTYILTDNITSDADGIVVERTSSIVVDGNGHTLQGSGSGTGIEAFNISSGFEAVTVKNFSIQNFSEAIASYWRPATICRNNITGDLYFWSSSDADIFENNIVGNIDVMSTTSMGILQNNIIGNINYIVMGGFASISGNNVTGAIWVSSDTWSSITDNNITGGIRVLDMAETYIAGNDISGGIRIDCRATISGNNIKGGINGQYAGDLTISGNNITTNHIGTGLSLGLIMGYADVLNNNIVDNDVGISIEDDAYIPSMCAIYHNNFINNTHQVSVPSGCPNSWDDGYSSGGNYWSDYNESDVFNGPYQNLVGSDGIGDAPYIINANNTDNYPLMLPFAGHNIAVTCVNTTKTVVARGIIQKIDAKLANTGSFPQTFSVTVYANVTPTQTLAIVLAAHSSTVLRFYWDTAEAEYGNYTISASASIILDETDTADNNFTDGIVRVGIPGDVGPPDGYVGIDDIFCIASHFSQDPTHPDWNPNYDITGDDYVGIDDIFIAAQHFGQEENP